ncbi:CLUMA_CG014751, isoform A [Clunio marinus]|uniref:CLUMA_CG014751, isoform A n=1 Tax=Clunio marinus TaxID=568069 RepID=A0A1J1IP50_9DIPT|nr:CLUMA_CG014751, isoform A [Clunio marinus]
MRSRTFFCREYFDHEISACLMESANSLNQMSKQLKVMLAYYNITQHEQVKEHYVQSVYHYSIHLTISVNISITSDNLLTINDMIGKQR